MRRCFVALIALLFCTSLMSGQQAKVLAPHWPVAQLVPKSQESPLPAPTRGSLVGGLWMTGPNLKSSIYLKNVLEVSAITVTPLLYLSNGKQFRLPDVTMEPVGTAAVNINDELQKLGIASYATLSGYVEIQYNWAWVPVCATIRVVDTEHSVIFTYGVRPATMPSQTSAAEPSAKAVVKGLWWKQESAVSGFVALSNTTSKAVPAVIAVTDNRGAALGTHSISVSPHGTKTVQLSEFQSSPANEGGIDVSYSGAAGDIEVNGGLQDQSVGYSANLRFTQAPSPSAKTSQLGVAALGLMVGAADPMMLFPAGTTFTPYSVLRNISDAQVTVTPTFWWMEAGTARSAPLKTFTVAPDRSRSLDVMSLAFAAGLKNFNGNVNLAFDVQGKEGGLLLEAGSVDQTNNYVFEVMPRGIGESASKSIGRWSTANGDDTMVTVWNPADEAQDFVFRLVFSGGHYLLPMHFAPRATRTFNISEIIQNQLPDAEGNIITTTVRDGSATLGGSHGDVEHILVAMDSGTYNVRKATCGTNCVYCDGYTSFGPMNPGSATFGVQRTKQYQFPGTYSTGVQYNVGTNWSSSKTSVATVASSTGVATGASPGSANIDAYFSDPIYQGQVCTGGTYNCPSTSGNPTGGGTVTNNTPILTGIDPSDWPSGATTPGVTFGGQYFGTNSPTLTFSPSSGISYALVSYNDTQIVANITVATGTPTEDVDVSVTNNGYGGVGFQSGGGSVSATSAPVYATVRAPLNTAEITIIGWINGNGPGLNPLPTGENSTLQSNLQNGTTSQQATCALQVGEWILGFPVNVSTSADSAYANAWLIRNSANGTPPSTITPEAQKSAGDYRLINDFGNGKAFVNIGHTPDPCKTGLVDWASAGESNQYNGYSSTSPAGQVYQIAEGRIGKTGQLGGETINGGRTVPWVWSVIEFNSANGTPNYSPPLAMFPTYYLYVNGTLTYTFPQSALATFTAKDETYQLTPSQIP
jgi:hypothetical protein